MVLDVEIMGKKARLLQKADNRLYIIDKHKEVLLGKNAISMCNAIDANMLQNADAYNTEDVNELLHNYENVNTSDEAIRYRANLIEFLSHKLGLERKDFTNELRNSLVSYARELINGSMTIEEVKNLVLQNDSVETMINGMELTEAMEQEKLLQNEINEKVSMYQIANEMKQDDWTEEEKSVQNLMAEFVYTTDTQIMDSNVKTPQNFVRTVLLQNTKALVTLLKEDGDKADMIDTIFKKMSLDEITGSDKKSFEKSIAKELRELRDYLRNNDNIDTTKTSEEIEKDLKKFLSDDNNMSLTKRLKIAYDEMQKGINESCNILQEKVSDMSKSIFAKTKEEKGGQTLDDILKNASQGEKGQGLFTRKVFENYFKNVSALDKRAMLASVLRGSKKVTIKEISDKELISEIKSRKLEGYDSILYVERDYVKSPLSNDDKALLAKYRAEKKNAKKSAPIHDGQNEQPAGADLKDEDLLAELKKLKPAGYEKLYYTERDLEKSPLQEGDKQMLDQYRSEKNSLAVGANFLGGLIRGAGPLFQKMMQGLPEESLPPELRMALRDVKSNLPPMPERVVKSQTYAMIKRSGGEVDRIRVEKSLGAASVGQTFLCKIYGPKFKDGKTVVIKLLRSDVQNRMAREEKVMLDCAGMVDEGMRQTYEGQLSIYHNELDLVKEAENIKAGTVYNGKFKDVESEKVNETISPTSNSLVIDEAPGKTLDSILLDAEKDRQDMMHRVLSKKENEDGTVTYFSNVKFDKNNFELTKEVRNNMIDKISELINQRDIMANICNSWLQEALFGNGYYHADLHAGNIMISKDKGTLIDYGNAVTFTADQQEAITRMMGAAAGAVMPTDDVVDVFFNSFTSLLDLDNDPEQKKLYTKEKQEDLKKVFEEILNMGSYSDAGQRIAAALIKAHEFGIKLPSAVYNFSQGQLRLQRSINDINDMIQKYKDDINKIDSATSSNTSSVIDSVAYVQKNVAQGIRDGKLAKDVFKTYIDIFEPVDKETFTKELLDNEFVEEKAEKGIRGVDKRKDFDNKYLDGLTDFKESIYCNMCFKKPADEIDGDEKYDEYGFLIDEKRPIQIKNGMPDFSVMRSAWDAFKKDFKDKKPKENESEAEFQERYRIAENKLTNILMPGTDYQESCYKMFGGMMKLSIGVSNAIADMDDNAMNEIIEVYEKWIPKRILLEDKIKELRNKQNSKKLNEEERTRLTDEIYTLYTELHEFQSQNNVIRSNFLTTIQNFSKKDYYGKELKDMYEEETTTTIKMENGEEKEIKLGELLKKQFETYTNHAYKFRNVGKDPKNPVEQWGLREDVPLEDKKQLEIEERAMADTYMKIATIQLKRFYEGRFDRQPDMKSFDFMKVMKDVLVENIGTTLKRMGVGALVRAGALMAINIAKALGKDPLEAMFDSMNK
ncbi:MAG: hypothetical protein J6N76_04950 [Lachnospiraceae bacterium]|nr:hypothetical protein [Lachnospiraceae bacterium]